MLSTLYDSYFLFLMDFKMSSAICFNFDLSKILSSWNELILIPNGEKKSLKAFKVTYQM